MMKEKQVQQAISRHFMEKGAEMVIPNIYFFDRLFECDALAVMHDDTTIEFEIKASKWDYLQDYKKKDKHERMESKNDLTIIPNRFYFVCPEGLIAPEEIPDEYAGLIWVCRYKSKSISAPYLKTVVSAPLIHNERINQHKWRELAVKLSKRLW